MATPVHVPNHGDLAGTEDAIGDGTERCTDIKGETKFGGCSVVRLLLERVHCIREPIPSVYRQKGDLLVLLALSDPKRRQKCSRSPYPTDFSAVALLI